MAKKKQFTEMVAVMVKPEMLKQLQKLTNKMQTSNSEFIRDLLERELNDKNNETIVHG